MQLQIRVDDLTGPEIAAFLEEHLADMRATSPPESVHALDLAGLRHPEVTFWMAWDGTDLVGCAALKQLSSDQAELKSMRTSVARRGKGIASQLLQHLIGEARRRGYHRLSLETGSMAFFEPARKLYEKFGFVYCDPLGTYQPDYNSAFMTREL